MNFYRSINHIFNVIRYNLKIIFSGRFIFFLLAGWIFFLLMTGIMLFSGEGTEINSVYDSLLFTGILIFFYPVVYNIQNDKDIRMLEIIFGVPDYRYKIYLLRYLIALSVMVLMLVLMAMFTWFAVLQIPVAGVVFQLCFPLFFLACLTFLFTTLMRNANGAAVIMIIIGIILFMLDKFIRTSKWNPFLNPYNNPGDMDITIWLNIVQQNRLMLFIGAVIALLWGLMNLQKREKLI
jgi:hypothetical protein